MLHFSCDLCGRKMRPGDERRYVVKMEIYAAHDPDELTEADLDQDSLDAVSELLDADDDLPHEVPAPAYKKLQFDLCPDCQKRFLRDPLGKEANQKFHFSKN